MGQADPQPAQVPGPVADGDPDERGTLYSASRERFSESMTDLEFKLSLPSVGILDWQAFDHAVGIGYKNAVKTLAAVPQDELAAYRAG